MGGFKKILVHGLWFLTLLAVHSRQSAAAGRNTRESNSYAVAIVGGGASGLNAARELSKKGINVFIFNQSRKPGGLVLTAFYWDKQTTKAKMLQQYFEILQHPKVKYLGGVSVGPEGLFTRADLVRMGFNAIVYATGAPLDKELDIPGKEAILPSTRIFEYYNRQLIDHEVQRPHIGKKVAIIGAGNSSADIGRYVLNEEPQVETLYLIIRRPPWNGLEHMDTIHFGHYYWWLDRDDFAAEINRYQEAYQLAGKDPAITLDQYMRKFIGQKKDQMVPHRADATAKVRVRYLVSPQSILTDAENRIHGLKLARHTVQKVDGEIQTLDAGGVEDLDVDTVISVMGYQLASGGDLPVQDGRFPTLKNGVSGKPGQTVEEYLLDVEDPIPVAVLGWARSPGAGRAINVAHDFNMVVEASAFAKVFIPYLYKTQTPLSDEQVQALRTRVSDSVRGAEGVVTGVDCGEILRAITEASRHE